MCWCNPGQTGIECCDVIRVWDVHSAGSPSLHQCNKIILGATPQCANRQSHTIQEATQQSCLTELRRRRNDVHHTYLHLLQKQGLCRETEPRQESFPLLKFVLHNPAEKIGSLFCFFCRAAEAQRRAVAGHESRDLLCVTQVQVGLILCCSSCCCCLYGAVTPGASLNITHIKKLN